MMRAIVVDDEEIDRLNLSTLLEDFADVEVVGEAKSVDSAILLIEREKPDVVFLDIHLGRQKGFKVLEMARHCPLVVITTSHPHYALQGFEVAAVDYLLKPIVEETLTRAVTRLRERLSDGADESVGGAAGLDDLQLFRLDGARHLVATREIQAICGERVYTRVYVRDGREFLHSRSLREWSELLPEGVFKRLDRSTIINAQELQMMEGAGKQRSELIFRGSGHRLRIGVVASRALRGVVEG